MLLIIRRTALTKQPVFHPELLPPYVFITSTSREKDAFQTSNAELGPVKLYNKKLSTESKKKNAVYYCNYSFSWYNQNWKWKKST